MMKINNSDKGFTLIELMIVIAVVGILAAIAIPQYQNYVIRTQVNRVMYETGQVRGVVERCLNEGRTALGIAVGQCDAGAQVSDLLDTTLGNTGFDNAGVARLGTPVISSPLTLTATVVATFNNNATATIHGQSLTWSRNVNGTWSCTTSVANKYRPSACL